MQPVALTWFSDTYRKGAATSLTRYPTSAVKTSAVRPAADSVPGASPDPNTVMSSPGAIALGLELLHCDSAMAGDRPPLTYTRRYHLGRIIPCSASDGGDGDSWYVR